MPPTGQAAAYINRPLASGHNVESELLMTKRSNNVPADTSATSSVSDPIVEATIEANTAPADPFADVPVITLDGDVSFRDFSDVDGNPAFKYEEINAAGRAARSPMALNFRHANAMFVRGSNQKELRPGSVYATIQAIANAAGKAGVPSYVMVSRLREAQIGNKRSKYCTQLPPLGWAEGWVNTAVTKGFCGIHASKQAPPYTQAAAQEAEQKLVSNG